VDKGRPKKNFHSDFAWHFLEFYDVAIIRINISVHVFGKIFNPKSCSLPRLSSEHLLHLWTLKKTANIDDTNTTNRTTIRQKRITLTGFIFFSNQQRTDTNAHRLRPMHL
jgi:hypothetical protein